MHVLLSCISHQIGVHATSSLAWWTSGGTCALSLNLGSWTRPAFLVQAPHLVQADWAGAWCNQCDPVACCQLLQLVPRAHNLLGCSSTLARVPLGAHTTYTIDTGPPTSAQKVLNSIAHQPGVLQWYTGLKCIQPS